MLKDKEIENFRRTKLEYYQNILKEGDCSRWLKCSCCGQRKPIKDFAYVSNDKQRLCNECMKQLLYLDD